MRIIYLCIILYSLNSTESVSQTLQWSEDYGPTAQVDFPTVEDEKYRWLYDLLFSEPIRRDQPDETFKSFRVHLKDSYSSFPNPKDITREHLRFIEKVEGKITYAGIVKKRYVYDLLQTSTKQIVINVRVHLQNPNEGDIHSFAMKIKAAEDLWNKSRVKTDFSYIFKFDIVPSASQAHFSVRVLDTTRGPYDTNWGRDWTGNVIAHEIGHMLGLGDEYQTVSGKFDCWKSSIMCTAWSGQMMPHHYYFVLRRLIN